MHENTRSTLRKQQFLRQKNAKQTRSRCKSVEAFNMQTVNGEAAACIGERFRLLLLPNKRINSSRSILVSLPAQFQLWTAQFPTRPRLFLKVYCATVSFRHAPRSSSAKITTYATIRRLGSFQGAQELKITRIIS